jgi:hypothetical protein
MVRRLFAVGVAQLVEHRIVASVVVGSSPIVHPIFYCYFGYSSELTAAPVTGANLGSDHTRGHIAALE